MEEVEALWYEHYRKQAEQIEELWFERWNDQNNRLEESCREMPNLTVRYSLPLFLLTLTGF